MSQLDGTTPEFPPLSDVMQKHLDGCPVCQKSLTKKPVAMGAKPELCSEWFMLLDNWAAQEGHVNNIVARDEYGNEPGK